MSVLKKRVVVYFENPARERMYKKVMKLSATTSMSVSDIGYMALNIALPEVEKQLEGLTLLDADAISTKQKPKGVRSKA